MKPVLILFLLAYLQCILAQIVLTEDDFDQKVIESRENWFVFLGTPYNGGSKKLRPDWDLLAARFLGTNINIEDPRLCTKQDVKKYPTIKWFRSGVGLKYILEPDFHTMTSFLQKKFNHQFCQLNGEHCNEQELKYLASDKVESREAREAEVARLLELGKSKMSPASRQSLMERLDILRLFILRDQEQQQAGGGQEAKERPLKDEV